MSTFFKVFIISLISAAALAVLVTMFKTKRGAKVLFLTVLQGVAALFAVNIIGLLTGVTLAVNWYTLGASAVFGAPGVISMLLLEVIFR
ncbi:MAG: pro-sigmaK processing inhibitor BofA family protein [Oscillospiraceae bacterium]|nr:pro-sigmaK processing inhibitor BofA family protein [Oscillospiraceae bacterium]